MISRRLLRIKVLKEVFSYLNSGNTNSEVAEKALLHGIHKTYELYHHLMLLVVEVRDYAQQHMESGKQKNRPSEEERNPNTKFIDNEFIATIEANATLKRFCEKQRLNWKHASSTIKNLYQSLLESELYQAYLSNSTRSFSDDKNFVIKFYEEQLEDSEALLTALEEQSIYWVDDVEFALSQVIKTFKTFKQEKSNDGHIMPMFKDKDDEVFATQLLRRAIVCNEEYRELIDKHTKNWDVERIAFMDIVIMVTAIAELVECKDVPVKVSLNEYIEIAKYYSTPNSSTFINGVLDKVVDELQQKNMLQKTEKTAR